MKFSIRDLLLVTVIVALAVAWWVDHRRQAREVKELKEQVDQQMILALERARSDLSPAHFSGTPESHAMNVKFSIRDLLLVTAIVAVLAAWTIDHWQRASEIQELKEQLEQGKKTMMKGGIF